MESESICMPNILKIENTAQLIEQPTNNKVLEVQKNLNAKVLAFNQIENTKPDTKFEFKHKKTVKTHNFNEMCYNKDSPFFVETFSSRRILNNQKPSTKFDKNSNFSPEKFVNLLTNAQKSETVDSWATSKSNFLSKINKNSEIGVNKMKKFNDSLLYKSLNSRVDNNLKNFN
jgi:hypothetical protein